MYKTVGMFFLPKGIVYFLKVLCLAKRRAPCTSLRNRGAEYRAVAWENVTVCRTKYQVLRIIFVLHLYSAADIYTTLFTVPGKQCLLIVVFHSNCKNPQLSQSTECFPQFQNLELIGAGRGGAAGGGVPSSFWVLSF